MSGLYAQPSVLTESAIKELLLRMLACIIKKYMSNKTPTQLAQLKSTLSSDVYQVMFEGETEAPFSSPLNTEKRKGTFVTADTKLPIYRSEDKYDSGTGWPSFTKPIEGSTVLREDKSLSSVRLEVVSSDTGAHLGHVFDDGPSDRGGKRYCMNGVALLFIPDEAP